MFISELDPTKPVDADYINQGDDDLRAIKTAIRQTFLNFVDGTFQYSPIELLGMYNFLTANGNNILWKGTVPGGSSRYLIAVDSNYVFYARISKSLWGTIIYSELTQQQMDTLFPNTYRICNGADITGSTINVILDQTIVKLPDLTDYYIRGISGTVGNTNLQTLEEDAKLDPLSITSTMSATGLSLNNASHNHGNDNQYLYSNPPNITVPNGTTATAGYVDVKNTHSYALPGKDPHVHTFPTALVYTTETAVTSTNKTLTNDKQVIRPKTYNCLPYTRIN